MPQQLDPRVRSEVKEYHIQGRSESAAFLAWFLFKFFRVDTEQASDAVCDSQNDKGIDGILVDDQTAEILLFQAKFAGATTCDLVPDKTPAPTGQV